MKIIITEDQYRYITEMIKLDIKVGDVIMGGKFKNKKVVVKSIGKNDKGDITINGKPLLRFRIIKEDTDSKDCKTEYQPAFDEAKRYWKKRLQDPTFLEKFSKVNSLTKKMGEEKISKYINLLGKIKFESHYDPNGSESAFAGTNQNNIPRVSKNCAVTEDYQDSVKTFIHEIAHNFFEEVGPFNPKIKWENSLKNIWSDDTYFYDKIFKQNEVLNNKKLQYNDNIKIEGVPNNVIKNIIKHYNDFEDNYKGMDQSYLCRWTEKESNLAAARYTLKKKPNENVTLKEFLNIVNNFSSYDINWYYIILCWISTYPNVLSPTKFLSNLNSLVAKVDQEKNNDELTEKWSEKYKRSIDCNNPKGFSQRAHCQGRKK